MLNSNRSRVKRFIENTNNKENFLKYMFNDSCKVTYICGKVPTTCHNNQRIKESCSLRRVEKYNYTGLDKNRGRLKKKKAWSAKTL